MTVRQFETHPVQLIIDGIEHYAEWRGKLDTRSTPFVLLHDGLGCIANWRSFPDSLATATGRPVFVYDRWGYGKSAPREAFPDTVMQDAAARLSRILDAAGIDDCVLVGHSDGGTIALLHATGSAPRIRGLVTIAAHVIVDPNAAKYLDDLDAMLATGTPPTWLKRFHGDRGLHLLACWIRVWRQLFENDWNIVPLLATIQAPLLVLQGAKDPYKIPDQLELICDAVPGTEKLLLEGLGHFPHLESPEIVIRKITEFVERLDVRLSSP